MRSWILTLALAACGAPAAHATLPRTPAERPGRDLASAKSTAQPSDHPAVADPRVVDLDIIRITARSTSPGGELEMEHVATGDLFREANAATKAGDTEQAIGIYRRIVAEFPDSKYAPVSLFDIAAIYDARRDEPNVIATLRELVRAYPKSRESVEGHLFIAAVQAEHTQFADAIATLDEALARTTLTYTDRLEAYARKGYCLLELHRYDDADAALVSAIEAWRQAPRVDDPYYIAMAHYYRGEIAHRKLAELVVQLPDQHMYDVLDQKRALAVVAYDHWRDSLDFKQAYWATAAGYQMSQIFVELWEATVKAPFPQTVNAAIRAQYLEDVHVKVRTDLEKALEGHRMNVELAKVYGVETNWSKGSAERVPEILEMLAKDNAGQYVTPE